MRHQPVLVAEVIEHLSPQEGDVLLDATVGHGGHAKAFLETAPNTRVVGIDADEEAIEVARQELRQLDSRVTLIHSSYARLESVVNDKKFSHVLFDLGIGSHQLEDSARGFSFRSPGPLTMRYGTAKGLPPSHIQAIDWLERKLGYAPDTLDLITGLKEAELADVIWRYGEERLSRPIARAIKQQATSISTAQQLATTIAEAVPKSYEHGRIHPATRTFQGLRLAVNRELESLELVLPQAVEVLEGGGRLAVISFHSLEDRIVKNYFRSAPHLQILTKKPVQASDEEKDQNPRARSAKLRVAQKTPIPHSGSE